MTPPRRKTGLIAAVVVVVVVVVLLALLYIPTYFGKSSSGKGGAGAGPVAFDQARSSANSSATAYKSTTWSVVFAAAIDSPTTLTFNTTNVTKLNVTCTFLPIGTGFPATVSVPAFSGSIGSGDAPFWGFFLKDSSGDLVLVVVNQGSAQALGVLTPATCPGLSHGLGLLSPIPANAVDSSTVLTATQAAGGSTFLSQHSSATVTFTLVGAFSTGPVSEPAQWTVSYSTCPPSGATGGVPSGTQYAQDFTVGALNGTVVNNSGVQTLTSCSTPGGGGGGPKPLSSVFSFGGVSNVSAGGNFSYDLAVTQTSNVTFGDIFPGVVNATGGLLSNATNLTVLSSTRALLAFWNFTGGFFWAFGAGSSNSTVIATGDIFELNGNAGLDGYLLTVTSTAFLYFTGNVTARI